MARHATYHIEAAADLYSRACGVKVSTFILLFNSAVSVEISSDAKVDVAADDPRRVPVPPPHFGSLQLWKLLFEQSSLVLT